jgi:hypothetical protein
MITTERPGSQFPRFEVIALIALLLLVLSLLFGNKARAQVCPAIDLSIISQIESSNNPLAYNSRSGACGAFQVTQVCLNDYNAYNSPQIAKKALFSTPMGRKVADWYLNKRIPQLLKHYKLPDTLDNRLVCYNAGIGKLCKGIIPQESKNYIKKYQRLAKAR